MTDTIEWSEPLTGPEINALGLPDDTMVSAEDTPLPLDSWSFLVGTPFYRLPADHPAYNVHRYNKEHGTDFVYWAGGDEAPDDWEGAHVLVLDSPEGSLPRIIEDPEPSNWSGTRFRVKVIGYTKKPQLVTEEASEPRCETRMVGDNMVHIIHGAHSFDAPANHGPAADDKGEAGDFIPCERTVRMCIEALPGPVPDTDQLNQGYNACHQNTVAALEALLPKPGRAEELVEAYDNASKLDDHSLAEFMSSSQADLVTRYTRWLIERGEIKG